ncbi:hypothetical protein [Anaerocolumna sp. MB42-C2]|uniref:hypothetical protein n=1 Tax=Anaerocolumna sp. MB42-C2 TaxID=3070997 RepID=UPI0027E0A6BB|nr:hypothetical protein [Anaerocolumna sp. MB42-C2]WMJ85477.1 hypothetical protein RBU59_15510 [Anaerocolumna sp. MB42-C2]
MKLKGLGRTIKVKPGRVQAIKTRFGCRIVVNCTLPEELNGYELEKLEDRIRTVLRKD